MKYILLVYVALVGFGANASLVKIEKPTGVKIGAVFNYWEKLYTHNQCYPDAMAFQIKTNGQITEDNIIEIIKGGAKDIAENKNDVKAFLYLDKNNQ